MWISHLSGSISASFQVRISFFIIFYLKTTFYLFYTVSVSDACLVVLYSRLTRSWFHFLTSECLTLQPILDISFEFYRLQCAEKGISWNLFWNYLPLVLSQNVLQNIMARLCTIVIYYPKMFSAKLPTSFSPAVLVFVWHSLQVCVG